VLVLTSFEGCANSYVNDSKVKLLVHVPCWFFSYLWNKTSEKGVGFLPPPPASVRESFTIEYTIVFERTSLKDLYVAEFAWKEPTARALNSTLLIENSNSPSDGRSR